MLLIMHIAEIVAVKCRDDTIQIVDTRRHCKVELIKSMQLSSTTLYLHLRGVRKIVACSHLNLAVSCIYNFMVWCHPYIILLILVSESR